MSDPRLYSTLTDERLCDLKLLATGATRKLGVSWECSRTRLAWFERYGYIVLGPSSPPSPARALARDGVRLTVERSDQRGSSVQVGRYRRVGEKLEAWVR